MGFGLHSSLVCACCTLVLVVPHVSVCGWVFVWGVCCVSGGLPLMRVCFRVLLCVSALGVCSIYLSIYLSIFTELESFL